MANIILGYRQPMDKLGNAVMSYSNSTHDALTELDHHVLPMGEGHKFTSFDSIPPLTLKQADLFLDLDSGRNSEGNLSFQTEKPPLPSAVRYIDTHGYPSFHKRLSYNYDHVFFAVWAKRDIFTHHTSVHWCPNASDSKYFYKDIQPDIHDSRPIDVGFFGSKGGLDRTDACRAICERHSWTTDFREIGRNGQRWPKTALAMAYCKVLFNQGQKHDGPNQRVIESMLMNRPLVTDHDDTDGMRELFEPGEHYLSYKSDAELANNIEWCIREPSLATAMAKRAYEEALNKHQVKHRVAQILEVSLG